MTSLTNPLQSSGYAVILVSVDLNPETESRVKLAGHLAESFSGHLIGVAAEEIFPPLYFEYPAGAEPTISELKERQAAQNLIVAANRFEHAAWMCKDLEWHSAFGLEPGFVESFTSRHARAADLVVVSQRTSGDSAAVRMVVDPGSLVLMAGRPVLVVPPEKDFLAAERIVIAWKDGREARRAVADSLPLLRRAKRVFVVTVGAESALEGGDEVGAYLTHHEVANEVIARPKPAGTVADELVDVAHSQNADLIVCGAYGHSRTRELIFGGVTRELLKRSPVCCLMSH